MAITLSILQDSVLALTGMTSTDSMLTTTMLTSFINEGVKNSCLFGRMFPMWITATATLNTFTSSAIGTDYSSLYISAGVSRTVADIIVVTDSDERTYQRANPTEFFSMFGTIGSVGVPKFWCWFARHLWLFPRISGTEYIKMLALLMPNTLTYGYDVLDVRESFCKSIINFAAHRVMQTLGRYSESALFLIEFYKSVNETLDFIPSNFDGRTPGLIQTEEQKNG